MTKNKYHNKKVVFDDRVFDSRKEARRYAELKLMERGHLIFGLECQKEYELIPAQYEQSPITGHKSSNGQAFKGKCIERSVKYIADFVYVDDNGQTVVEDAKGVRTKEYIIKRKLMLYKYGISIREV